MFPIPSWAIKAVAGVLLAAGLVGGALWYRSHVYDEGYQAGVANQQKAQETAIAKARASDKAISDKAQDDLRAQIKDERNAHQARSTALEAALASARADSVRLTGDLARLHDAAVRGASPSAPGASAGIGPQADPAPSALAGTSQFSLADLMRNDEVNYTACRINAQRLGAIQDWYNAIRNGDAAGADRAVREAPAD
jgi:hypothetical protein